METNVLTADKNIWGNGEEKERTSTKSSYPCMYALCCAMSALAESTLFPLVGDITRTNTLHMLAHVVVSPEKEYVYNY